MILLRGPVDFVDGTDHHLNTSISFDNLKNSRSTPFQYRLVACCVAIAA